MSDLLAGVFMIIVICLVIWFIIEVAPFIIMYIIVSVIGTFAIACFVALMLFIINLFS